MNNLFNFATIFSNKMISKIRRIFLVVLSVIFASTTLAQKQKRNPKGIVFNQSHVKLGTIDFGTKYIYDLNYYNSSKKSIKITDIETSDSLINLTWDKSKLSSGLFSKISVDLPTNNNGIFSKTIVVHSTARNSPVRLIISGKISDKPETVKITEIQTEAEMVEAKQSSKSEMKNSRNKKFKRIHLDENAKTGSSKEKGKEPPPKTGKSKNEKKEKVKIR